MKVLFRATSTTAPRCIFAEIGGVADVRAAAQVSGRSRGYSGVEKISQAAFARFSQLLEGMAKLPNIVGFCYTQLSDVEQEVNGM